jgi:hypothetical protein
MDQPYTVSKFTMYFTFCQKKCIFFLAKLAKSMKFDALRCPVQ